VFTKMLENLWHSMWVIPESQNYTACFIIFIFENRKKYNHKNLSVRTDFPFRKFFHVLRNVDVSFGTISTVLIFPLSFFLQTV
jgi:hypothetical protein